LIVFIIKAVVGASMRHPITTDRDSPGLILVLPTKDDRIDSTACFL